ncbi:MAG: hypothetical protein QNJ77_09465 [Acidimicrobiia bacterium]|nr:hypothetical protein [Acidimicrobiia bacterium]
MPTVKSVKRLAILTVAIVGTMWLLLGTGSAITTDTPVLVLAADDPVLRLPVSPSVERIVDDLAVELNALAAAEPDQRIADSLRRLSSDESLLHQIAASPVEMFDGGTAAATATAVYDVSLDPDLVTVVVATVELIPAYGSTAAAHDHEDGHALINRTVARRCAAAAVAESVNQGRQGAALIDGIISYLSSKSDGVHAMYHSYVASARYGEHIRHAEQALADVAVCQ